MFDYTLAHWGTFIVAAILLNITPGPDIAYVLAHTLRNGKRAGFAALFGVWSGLFLHVVLAAMGLSAIIATSATAFILVKWAGAMYLILLGIQAFRSSRPTNQIELSLVKSSSIDIYRQGILVATLNPKVAFFFLAFLPQFVEVGAGPESAQLFLHGFLILVIGALIEPFIIIIGANLATSMKQSPRFLVWAERGMGVVFIGLGLRLALTERS